MHEPSHFEHSFRVTWENTDTAGYIHNSAIFRHFEVAELEWFRTLGIHWKEFPEVGFPRIHVEATFRNPLTFDAICRCEVRLTGLRAAVYTLGFRVFSEGALTIEGSVQACCVSAENGKARHLPERMRGILEPFLDS